MKKKLTKKQKQLKADFNFPYYVAGVVLLMAMTMFIHLNGGFKSWTENSIETDQCYLSRDYKFFQVKYAYQGLKEADLVEMTPAGNTSYYFLYAASDAERRARSFDFVRKNYTLIPCDRF